MKKATKKATLKKAALEEATNKDLLEEGPLKRGPLECHSEKGPLETQERGPPVQVCQQDLETRLTTEPSKVPPHDRNDDLRGGDLQDKLESLLEEQEQPQLQPPASELEQGPPTTRERPNDGPAEVPKQPKKLHHGLAQLQPLPLESHESDPSKRGLLMTTFQPRQWSLAPRLGEDQEEKEEDSPSFGRCRPLSRVADSGPKAKVNNPYILALPSLKSYPRMCGLNPEPDLRPDLSPVIPSSIPGALMSQGWPNKGPADDYLLPQR